MLYIFLRLVVTMAVAFLLIFLVFVAFDNIAWALALLLVYVIFYESWRYHGIVENYRRELDNCKRKLSISDRQNSDLSSEITLLTDKAANWQEEAVKYQSLANDLQVKLSECESKLSHIECLSLCDSTESLDDKNLSLALQLSKKNAVIQQMSDELKVCKTICRIPKSVSFHPDGMPVFYNSDFSKPYGDWTVYINQKSGIYHLDYFCSSYSSERSHLFNVLGTNIRPCKKCASGKIRLPGIPLWYTNYLAVKPKAKELGLLGLTLSPNQDYIYISERSQDQE